jgi:hypothetical protein
VIALLCQTPKHRGSGLDGSCVCVMRMRTGFAVAVPGLDMSRASGFNGYRLADVRLRFWIDFSASELVPPYAHCCMPACVCCLRDALPSPVR